MALKNKAGIRLQGGLVQTELYSVPTMIKLTPRTGLGTLVIGCFKDRESSQAATQLVAEAVDSREKDKEGNPIGEPVMVEKKLERTKEEPAVTLPAERIMPDDAFWSKPVTKEHLGKTLRDLLLEGIYEHVNSHPSLQQFEFEKV